MSYWILSDHLYYIYLTSSTLPVSCLFLYTQYQPVLENGGLKSEPALFSAWDNKTVFTLSEYLQPQERLVAPPHAGPAVPPPPPPPPLSDSSFNIG